MPVFKAISGDYRTENDLRNLVNYAAMGKDGTQNQCGAQGVILGEPDFMYRQMEDVKKQFHKERNRQAMHYVLSFSGEEEEYIGVNEALQTGYAVADFFRGWQVVFGIHTDTDNLHIHFVVNCTSYETGRAFDMGPAGLQEIKDYIKAVVWNYYVRSLPEGERRETVCRKAGAMVEINIYSHGHAGTTEACSAADSRMVNKRLFERLPGFGLTAG